MGNLLGSPVTEKETHRGIIHEKEDSIPYAVSSMQGWRVHMEDAHICQTELYAQEQITTNSSSNTRPAVTNTTTTHGHDETDMDLGQNKKAKKDDASSSAPSPANSPLDVPLGEPVVEPPTTAPVVASPAEAVAESSSSSETKGASRSTTTTTSTRQLHLPRHSLFAVFDGHGGTYAAQYAGHNFCRVLSVQPAFVQYARYVQQQIQLDAGTTNTTNTTNDDNDATPTNDDEKDTPSSPTATLTPAQRAELDRRGLESLESALRDAFIEIDREIYQTQHPHHPSPNPHIPPIHPDAILPINKEEEDSGSTAVVVILTPQWIVCANAGDSRAVYSKDRHRSIPLSYDHKPNDEADETEGFE